MTFFKWMLKQTKRDDVIGDLARDIKDDARINRLTIQSADEWQRRIWDETTWSAVRRAFRKAHAEYNQEANELTQ